VGVLSGGAALSSAPAAQPVVIGETAEPRSAPPSAPAPDDAEAAPRAPAVEPRPAWEARITSGEFKGGLVAIIEDGASFAEALPQLVALDAAHSAQARSYWWCGPSASGGPRLFAKSGLPDPYFFSRMLMWQGR
jgi:hypothetical protein